MRWKLLIISSLLAAVAGAGAVFALGHLLGLDANAPLISSGWPAFAALLAPVALITTASIFVYRHTPRRRPLQAAATVLLSIALTLALLVLGSYFLARPAPAEPRPDTEQQRRTAD